MNRPNQRRTNRRTHNSRRTRRSPLHSHQPTNHNMRTRTDLRPTKRTSRHTIRRHRTRRNTNRNRRNNLRRRRTRSITQSHTSHTRSHRLTAPLIRHHRRNNRRTRRPNRSSTNHNHRRNTLNSTRRLPGLLRHRTKRSHNRQFHSILISHTLRHRRTSPQLRSSRRNNSQTQHRIHNNRFLKHQHITSPNTRAPITISHLRHNRTSVSQLISQDTNTPRSTSSHRQLIIIFHRHHTPNTIHSRSPITSTMTRTLNSINTSSHIISHIRKPSIHRLRTTVTHRARIFRMHPNNTSSTRTTVQITRQSQSHPYRTTTFNRTTMTLPQRIIHKLTSPRRQMRRRLRQIQTHTSSRINTTSNTRRTKTHFLPRTLSTRRRNNTSHSQRRNRNSHRTPIQRTKRNRYRRHPRTTQLPTTPTTGSSDTATQSGDPFDR